jgi:septum formation protein
LPQPTIAQLILASASPRRRQLLALMGLCFEVVSSDTDETVQIGEPPIALARRLSLAKAEAIASLYPDALIIAADTMVVLDQEILGKPADQADALAMLARLRGRQHLVYTGLTLLDAARSARYTQVARTPVLMRAYDDKEVQRYVASGDPLDKAGAYAIQYADFRPVERINGCYANVMGLPMCHCYRVLSAWGIRVPIHPLQCCPLAVREGCPYSADITQASPQSWESSAG